MAQKHLQLLRNNTPYTSYTAAYDALKSMSGATYADGTPIIARYNGNNDEIKTLLGIVNKKSGDARVDIINDVQASILRAYNLEDATSGAIATNDSIEVALNKLENQVKAAKAAATTVVKEGVDNPHMAITSSTDSQTSATTYTITLTDVASDTALTAEIDARKAVDGQDGQTYVANSGSKYISGATSLNDADVKLNNAVASLSDAVNALDASSVSGASKVVIDVTQEDGQITATAANLTGVKLDGYTEGTDADVAATDTLGQALGKLQAQINAMDKAASAVDGKVVTTVTEADGKVTETKANVKDLQLGGYSKTSDSGAISGTDTVNVALSKLENNIAAAQSATTVASTDKSINVTTAATGTDINVNIKNGEHVLAKNGNAGLYTDIKLSAVTPSSTAIKEEYSLIATDGTALGTNIKIYKDSHIVSITYITDSSDAHYQNLEYKYIDASGNTQTEYVDISSLVLENEFASGVTVTDHVAHGVVDTASEKDESNNAFLTVGADGFKVSGIKNAIDTKINKLDVSGDTAVAGQYVAAIEETDGIVAVKTRANVSDAVLTGYAKGEKPASTAIAATDDVKGAIAKLEHQIDDAKAAATTKVEKDAQASHLTLTSSTAADGSVTYTIGESDIASKTDLDAEIAARKAVDGQTGQTYSAKGSANYINNATSLNDADVKLDAALKAEETARINAINALDYTDTAATGQYVSEVNEANGVISVSRLNVSEAVLNNYTKGTKPQDTAVSSTDTINQAISKLEHQIDDVEGNYLTGITVNGVTGNVADNVATVVISGSSINLGTGYTGSESGAPTTADTVNQAIAKLYNKSNANTSKGKTITITSGESSTNFEVNVDNTTTATAAMALYESDNHNAIQGTTNGLYVSSIWDCGTYDEPAGN